ncbi:MAG: trehalose-phosphatase [Candidatus Hadarchaeia archaeon]
MKNVLDEWEKTRSVFMDPVFLMTDFDGTLTPIVGNPDEAKLSEEMRGLISQLVPLCPVGIISGRSLLDLRLKVGVKNVYYSGNHGFEIEGPGVDFVLGEVEGVNKLIDEFCSEFRDKADVEDVVLENKGYTASVHYRLVSPDKIQRVRNVFGKVAQPYIESGDLRVTEGKKIFEIRPSVDWDKGKAVSYLLTELNFEEETLPIYLGDDSTDEDAFKTIEEGIGIFVGEKRDNTMADYFLTGVKEVETFLRKLVGILR